MVIDPPGTLTLDNLNVVIEAAVQGAGIAWVPRDQVAAHIESRRLLSVLEDWSPSFPGLCLYYPSSRHLPKAMAEFIMQVRRGSA